MDIEREIVWEASELWGGREEGRREREGEIRERGGEEGERGRGKEERRGGGRDKGERRRERGGREEGRGGRSEREKGREEGRREINILTECTGKDSWTYSCEILLTEVIVRLCAWQKRIHRFHH